MPPLIISDSTDAAVTESFSAFRVNLFKRYDLLVFGIIVASMLIIRHRSNIKRLIQGNENKLGQKKKG